MNKDLIIRLEKEDTSFFLCKILKPGYLDNIKGTYITPKGYFVSEEETNIFDQKFLWLIMEAFFQLIYIIYTNLLFLI